MWVHGAAPALPQLDTQKTLCHADSRRLEEAICINQMFHASLFLHSWAFSFFLQELSGFICLCEDWKYGVLEHSFLLVKINFFLKPLLMLYGVVTEKITILEDPRGYSLCVSHLRAWCNEKNIYKAKTPKGNLLSCWGFLWVSSDNFG